METDSRRRPLSPHLQVYRLPLTALVSISHRMTGIVLSVGSVLLFLLVMAAGFDRELFDFAHDLLLSVPGLLLLFLWSFALCFHMCSGIRHIVWDIGYGLSLPTAQKSSVAVVLFSVLLTLVVWASVLL